MRVPHSSDELAAHTAAESASKESDSVAASDGASQHDENISESTYDGTENCGKLMASLDVALFVLV